MANTDLSTFRRFDVSTFRRFDFSIFRSFIISSFRHFVISSFRLSPSTYPIGFLLLISAFLMISGFRPVEAQVMHLEIRVDSEFGLGDLVMPNLTKQAAPGDGLIKTAYDHENSGQLTIYTTENVHLIVNITSPDYLIRDEENILPLDLRIAYVYSGINGPIAVNPVAETTTTIRMSPGNLLINEMTDPPLKFETFLFFYGSVDVGDADPGVYEGRVQVQVEYP